VIRRARGRVRNPRITAATAATAADTTIFSLSSSISHHTCSLSSFLTHICSLLHSFPTYHLFYLSFSSAFSLPPLRSLLHARYNPLTCKDKRHTRNVIRSQYNNYTIKHLSNIYRTIIEHLLNVTGNDVTGNDVTGNRK